MLRTPTLTSRVIVTALATIVLALGCGKDEVLPVDEAVQEPGEDDSPPRPAPTNPDADDDFGDDTLGPATPRPNNPPTATGVFGQPCDSDADCGNSATCMLSGGSDFLGGGPAHGYCTADCMGGAVDCSAIDANATCVEQNGGAFCMAGCVLGTPAPGETKCQNRLDLACEQLQNSAVCLPMCRNDEDCDGDRKCDLGIGVCVDELPAGASVGAECTVDEDCYTGICFPLDETKGYCSGSCNFGTVIADNPVSCGSSLDPATPGQPICLPAAQGSGLGDSGLCGIRCNCDDDCGLNGAVCEALLDDPQEALDLLGTVGICVGATVPDGGTPAVGIPCTGPAPDAGLPDAG